MLVTRIPCDLRIVPRLLAIMPLPTPLITPPVTSTYFIAALASGLNNPEDISM